MARELKISMDIDGVILDFDTEFKRVFKLFGGESDLSNIQDFSFESGINKEEERALFLSYGYIMQSNLQLCKDFAPMIDYMLKDRGQKMYFVTARQDALSKKSAARSIESILDKMYGYSVVYDRAFSVTCSNRGSKLDILKYMDVEYFVDDRRKTCLELSQNGIKCFMPRKSYNKLPENTPNIIQYDDSSEIVEYLKSRH